jgi:ribosomal protein S12 methylthiotransferase accessory factor
MAADGEYEDARQLRWGDSSLRSPSARCGQATAALEHAATRLGLRPRWRPWAGGVSLAECDLLDDSGIVVSEAPGFGKGDTPAQARLHALAEALERHLAGPASLSPQDIRFVPAERLAHGVLAHEASAPLLTRLAGSALACYSYQALHTGYDDAALPLYLGAPWYAGPQGRAHRDHVGDRTDYEALARYSVQSGYGLAPTLQQATVHALLETVERDACSLLTIRTCLAGRRPTVFDPHTLPEVLARLHIRAQREVDATIHLVDATTDLGIPTVLAYCTPRQARPYLRGQAAALSTDEAVTRAITELLETQLPHATSPPRDLSMLKPYPALQRCARFDLTDAVARARTTPFREHPSPQGPQAQLNELLARLAAAGFTAYRRHLAKLPAEVSAVHTLIPGLERFFAIVKGTLVLPGTRGLSESGCGPGPQTCRPKRMSGRHLAVLAGEDHARDR